MKLDDLINLNEDRQSLVLMLNNYPEKNKKTLQDATAKLEKEIKAIAGSKEEIEGLTAYVAYLILDEVNLSRQLADLMLNRVVRPKLSIVNLNTSILEKDPKYDALLKLAMGIAYDSGSDPYGMAYLAWKLLTPYKDSLKIFLDLVDKSSYFDTPVANKLDKILKSLKGITFLADVPKTEGYLFKVGSQMYYAYEGTEGMETYRLENIGSAATISKVKALLKLE